VHLAKMDVSRNGKDHGTSPAPLPLSVPISEEVVLAAASINSIHKDSHQPRLASVRIERVS